MIQFKPVTLADKTVIDGFFSSKCYEQSSCTFTNLFMWQSCYQACWCIVDNCLCVQVTYGGSTYLLPPFANNQRDFAAAVTKLEQYYTELERPLFFKAATPDLVAWFEAMRPGYFKFIADRDNFDYVYNTRDLIDLQGRKFHMKKNQVNKFKKIYSQYEYRALDATLTEDCIKFAIDWCAKREQDDPSPTLICERDAIITVLRHWDQLDVVGGTIFINGKLQAFSFGELINQEMAVIHVEKATADYTGIYQVINQEFCRDAWSQTVWINREEDMGIPGIRKAKESYCPARMIEKYDVQVIHDEAKYTQRS